MHQKHLYQRRLSFRHLLNKGALKEGLKHIQCLVYYFSMFDITFM